MESGSPYNLGAALSGLKAKDKAPRSATVLNNWIAQAEKGLHSGGGRLGWLIATTVVAAVLQQATDRQERPRFLLKGGTLLQHKLPGQTRTTTDLDGLVTGDLDDFIAALDPVLDGRWGPLELARGPVEIIDVPYKVVKPRRFDVVVKLNGVTWRRIQVEISPAEGSAGDAAEMVLPPSLAGFGLLTPDRLAALQLRYQIAQKVHAATDPHNPPDYVNDRAHDVVDLVLILRLAKAAGEPTATAIRGALVDIFTVRADEASQLGRAPRPWPDRLVPYPHWTASFNKAAGQAGLTMGLDEAITLVNAWLDEIHTA
ncbi:MAG: nucleotidyl transferase AbiEii/AbiGii toxin family protein [Bifidobacteriaceae bacterium]|jgi:hypothetical protein|nr:nucleotidyl transferase AbiEii/AbiGii toxin family protein [Bifidobacteriaceae bacterium]